MHLLRMMHGAYRTALCTGKLVAPAFPSNVALSIIFLLCIIHNLPYCGITKKKKACNISEVKIRVEKRRILLLLWRENTFLRIFLVMAFLI